MRAISIKWLDLIVAVLLIFVGSLIWGGADAIVGYWLQARAPEKDEFLAIPPVRQREFALKTIQVELDSTRTKWIEQRRLSSPDSMARLRSRMDDLERRLAAAEEAIVVARKQASKAGSDAAVRAAEFSAKTLQAELDATRVKWVEQSVAAAASPAAGLWARVDELERSAIAAEAAVVEARRRASQEFTAASFWFTVRKRLMVLSVALIGTGLAFWIIYAAGFQAAGVMQFRPSWRVAMAMASFVLAAVYGYQVAGPAAAVGVLIAGLFLLLKP